MVYYILICVYSWKMNSPMPTSQRSRPGCPELSSIPKRLAICPEVGIRLRPILVRFLILLYSVLVVAFGYWYWMRPVRVDQFKDAQEKWRAIAAIYHIPIPKDERWGW